MKRTIEPSQAGPRRSLCALRGVATLTTVSVLAQPVLAGGYLAGEFDFLGLHETNAHTISSLLLIQAVAAVVYRRAGRGSSVPLVLTAVQFAAAGLQVGMGYSRSLAVHIPLGVLLVLLTLHMCIWVYRPSARLSRTDRKPYGNRTAKGSTHEPVA